MRYNKTDLIRFLSKYEKVKQDDARKVIDASLRSLRAFLSGMKAGDTLELRGLGVFHMKLQRGRDNMRNPGTGERAVMSARRRLGFTPSKTLKKEFKKV
ncbi:MAG: HU family DNA-binding protein [Candidatus Heimdallarchaeaceae archaeon]